MSAGSVGADTVGAVAIDAAGNLAVGNSTGGTSFKHPGRVGDTPIIGCGLYADNTMGAAACTGWGEQIMKTVLAKTTVDQIALLGSATDAANVAIAYFRHRIGGLGGVICISPKGQIGFAHSTPYLAHGIAAKGWRRSWLRSELQTEDGGRAVGGMTQTCSGRHHGPGAGRGLSRQLPAPGRVAGLTGWVRNRWDGAVEALLEGETAAVDAMLDWCREGPPMAYVSGWRSASRRTLRRNEGFGCEDRKTIMVCRVATSILPRLEEQRWLTPRTERIKTEAIVIGYAISVVSLISRAG